MVDNKIYVYRIRHIPTGLYYQTVKGRFDGEKSNLSFRGKVYLNRKPPLPDGNQYISDAVIKKANVPESSLRNQSSWRSKQRMLHCGKEDWEIVKYEIREVIDE